MDLDEPVEIPIDGVLDLHTFAPREVRDLVAQYVEECARRGIDEVRISPGKGTGALRGAGHAVLGKRPLVVAFRLAGEGEGGWGATRALLRRPRETRS